VDWGRGVEAKLECMYKNMDLLYCNKSLEEMGIISEAKIPQRKFRSSGKPTPKNVSGVFVLCACFPNLDRH
jgi:hypothetical protein